MGAIVRADPDTNCADGRADDQRAICDALNDAPVVPPYGKSLNRAKRGSQWGSVREPGVERADRSADDRADNRADIERPDGLA